MIDDRPFEWLTSPASLDRFLQSPIPRVLHVGCGSSRVAEHLCERFGDEIEHVVNIDCDEETLAKKRAQNDDPRIIYKVVDFCSNDPFAYSDFDLVIDKSTLDCTLCSDNASAALLALVFRSLRVGGTYLLISFHSPGLLRPILEYLDWSSIEEHVMERQTEDWRGRPKEHAAAGTVNVFVCRKGSDMTLLDRDAMVDHIHRVNDEWFQKEHPLVTQTRRDALQHAFGSEALSLKDSYCILFTEAEREHLSMEHFLQDWEAFDGGPSMTYEVALAFLQEMQ